MNIKVCLYEDWMKDAVVKLFCEQYNVDQQSFDRYFDNFYEHPFQRGKCIRVVAVENGNVAGFQSFFFWPYNYGGSLLNSYQSGNSLVHPGYRGKGVFRKLLEFIYEQACQMDVELLMGFPVEASKNSFLRNGWKNILDMKWYVKLINPIGIIRPFVSKKFEKLFSPSADAGMQFYSEENSFRLDAGNDFQAWRNQLPDEKKWYFVYKKGPDCVMMELCLEKRRFGISNLIIGDIRLNNFNEDLIYQALKLFIKNVWRAGNVCIISIAINSLFQNSSVLNAMQRVGFKLIKKEISFIIKHIKDNIHADDPANWELYRSDIDTW